MKRVFHSGIAVVGLIAAFTFASGVSAMGYSPDHDLGSPGQANAFGRTITLSADTKWVNVDRGESVKFIVAQSGQSFVWHFDTARTTLDLGKVAPSGTLSGHRVDAYVTQRRFPSD